MATALQAEAKTLTVTGNLLPVLHIGTLTTTGKEIICRET